MKSLHSRCFYLKQTLKSTFYIRLCTTNDFFPSGFFHQFCNPFSSSRDAIYVLPFLILLDFISISEQYNIWSSSLRSFRRTHFHHLSCVQILSSAVCSQTTSIYVLLLGSEVKFHAHIKLQFCMLYFNILELRMRQRDYKLTGRRHY